ncbi:uncharacterized protein DFL_003704 [Arthrobotrys flagrans]|uniref:Uncharacterized protein n=1 Tax=Arthrobotrys flagrans TaxID=97331 RepID=A0A437A2R8_ARTFL|nr:hypothetical protein DFL_003704 [Arthrobotrys flagrans]
MQCSLIKTIAEVYNITWGAFATGEYASEYLYYERIDSWLLVLVHSRQKGRERFAIALQPVSVLACLEQRQFCNPSNGRCDTPSSSRIPVYNSTELEWDNLQKDTVRVLDTITFPFIPISYLVDNRGASLLLADAQTANGKSTNLSPEQWKLEVTNFMNIALAGLKMAIVRFGTGEQRQGPNYHRSLGDSEVCKRRMIKFRDDTGNYTSYSLSGVLIIIFAGLVIIVLSFLIEPIFERLAKAPTGSMKVKYEAWRHDESLMIYSASMERIDVGPWVLGKYDIPRGACDRQIITGGNSTARQ